jgi:hypothetical protein
MGVKEEDYYSFMQLGPQKGSIRSQNQRSLFPCLRFVSVNRTSCLGTGTTALCSGRHRIATSPPSTSQLGSRRSLGDRSISRVPGVCLNYGNRPRVPAPGFDSYFWNCARRRRHPIPISTVGLTENKVTSLLVRSVAPAQHPRIVPPDGSFNNWRLVPR